MRLERTALEAVGRGLRSLSDSDRSAILGPVGDSGPPLTRQQSVLLAVRRAFLHAVPRQDIVDRLIIPLNDNAEVRNAQVAVPGEPVARVGNTILDQSVRATARRRKFCVPSRPCLTLVSAVGS